MTSKPCLACGKYFLPRPQTPNQSYCSESSCQRTRRRRWQKEKLKTDPDYLHNQKDAQRAWFERHPGYWRQYRAIHSSDIKSIRDRQHTAIAKMDASNFYQLPNGIYRITLISPSLPRSNGGWLAEIMLV